MTASSSDARLAAVQALFQMEQTGQSVAKVLADFRSRPLGLDHQGAPMAQADPHLFTKLVTGVVASQTDIDATIRTHLAAGWRIERINATSLAILRTGIYELRARPDVSPAIILHEYVALAQSFFDAPETGFINGLLDAVRSETGPRLKKPFSSRQSPEA